MSRSAHPDRERKVFVVHGRNAAARAAMYAFLRSIGLTPIEWSHARALAGEANPYIGQILDAAFDAAQAVVVLMKSRVLTRRMPQSPYQSCTWRPLVGRGMSR